jgi:broad specificity phosphatase PhoE
VTRANDDSTTIYLIRHADAIPELDGHIGAEGYEALGLSARGEAQAAALARRLHATKPIAAVYSSPARRARETAHPIAAAFGLDVQLDERLREVVREDGALDALPIAQRAVAVREYLTRFAQIAWRDGTWTALEGTEPPQEVRERMREAVLDLARRHRGERVVALSHAGAINAFFAALLGLSRDFFFPTGNTSVSVVRVQASGMLLVRLNDTAHLEGAGYA